MSLINDALKKAQQQRSEDAGAMAATGAGMSRGNAARGGKSLAVLAGGALALVVISVGATFFLLNRRAPAPAPAVAPAPKAEETKPKADATTPKIEAKAPAVASVVPAAPSVPSPNPTKSVPIESKPAPAATVVAAQKTDDGGRKPTVAEETKPPVPTPVQAAAVSSPPSEPAKPAAPQDERIHQFLDNLRVAGVKAAGNDSRVLMNDKMFRVNEIVDRTLSLRLIKVEADNLTFSDINGAFYVKYF